MPGSDTRVAVGRVSPAAVMSGGRDFGPELPGLAIGIDHDLALVVEEHRVALVGRIARPRMQRVVFGVVVARERGPRLRHPVGDALHPGLMMGLRYHGQRVEDERDLEGMARL